MFFFAFDVLQYLLLVKLAYKSVGNFKKNPNIVQSSSIAVPGLTKDNSLFVGFVWHHIIAHHARSPRAVADKIAIGLFYFSTGWSSRSTAHFDDYTYLARR